VTQARAKLLPFYLAVDVSASMSGAPLDAVNQILPRIIDAIAQNPIIADKVRFAMIDFSEDAQLRLPLCDVLDPGLVVPGFSTRGLTSYAAAFTLLRSEIESNVAQLKADGFAVHRPAAFLLSDGAPTDDEPVWQAAFQSLISSPMYPNFVPCGVGDGIDARILQSLIHPAHGPKAMKMYISERGEDVAKAIGAIAELLVSSVLASGHSMAQGGSGMILPDRADLPQGISPYTADDDDFV
jgi:uncharacterized protein YegL